eukprot:Skav205246  [mRNA]  locus=scaffold1794:429884:430795:- [translate_table: standard]
MAWQKWTKSPSPWADREPLARKKPKDPKKPKDQADLYTFGFDGKRLKIPRDEHGGASGSGASSSGSAREIAELKDMMRQMINGERHDFSEAQLRLLQNSPRDAMREKQKELNKERKAYNRERNLQIRIQQNQEKYENWLHHQRNLIKAEKERYQMEQDRLRKELDKLQNPVEPMEDDEDLDLGLGEGNQNLDRRVQAAERAAEEAQNAMLMMQTQLHQICYYQQTAAQAAALGATLTAPLSADCTAPAAAGSPKPNVASPQMPRGVRNGALKSKDIREKPAKTKAAAEEVVDLEAEGDVDKLL